MEDDLSSSGKPMRHVLIQVLTGRDTDLETRMRAFLEREEVADLRVHDA